MESKYNHQVVEANKVSDWNSKQIFKAGDKSKEPFCIVIPPPNITSKLHLGHAQDVTIQDIIIRYKRMRGYDALWLPGMDHAGIATQAKVDEKLQMQGINKLDIGREKFLEEAWKWKDEHDELIRNQWNNLGLSVDYSREKFTLDEDLSKTVERVFIEMYQKGLIYRGEQIINWDPMAQTALSNIEVIHEDIKGAEHYFKYVSVDDPTFYLEVMTTRPETMFGDGALAINPNDERYLHLVGKVFIVPNTTIKIPVIIDEYVSMDKGSGVVKITVAHDPNDFLVGQRHKIPPKIIMNNDGSMASNKYVPEVFQGLDRFEARKLQVQLAKENGLLIEVKEIIHSVGHSERTGVVVEPLLSKQWFVKMDGLASKAILNQMSENKVKFHPERFEKIFINWMEGVYDWCISRQLWWGHRIPAWYKDGEVYVGSSCPGEGWTQDEDVLDTWFSSALWPFSTLGWNENSDDFNRYFPTGTLVTGYDIIFFWVSRMIFQSLEFTNNIPFKDVVIHGLIRDSEGKKMSKSLGNGIDPSDMIEKYGADALRYYLTTSATPGSDLNFQEDKLLSSWNFINKVWNASRFVKMQLGDDFKYSQIDIDNLTSADKWILSKFNSIIDELNRNMDNYEFVVASTIIYDYIWNDFCNWYIEFSKLDLNKNVLYFTLINSLKILHPFMPFVTEEIYSTFDSDNYIALQEWPEYNTEYNFENAILDQIIEEIRIIRNLRIENKLSNKVSFPIIIETKHEKQFNDNLNILTKFMNSNQISIVSSYVPTKEVMTFVGNYAKMYVVVDDIVNSDEEVARINLEIKKINEEINRASKMLSNSNFISKAPQSKIDEEQLKLSEYSSKLEELEKTLKKYS